MHFNAIGESANWVLNAFIYPREWLPETRWRYYVTRTIGSVPELLMFVTETLPSVSGMLLTLRRNFTRSCFASYATDHSTMLGLKQDITGLLAHQISQRCDLWQKSSFEAFCFHLRSCVGFDIHTLTGTVGDQWLYNQYSRTRGRTVLLLAMALPLWQCYCYQILLGLPLVNMLKSMIYLAHRVVLSQLRGKFR